MGRGSASRIRFGALFAVLVTAAWGTSAVVVAPADGQVPAHAVAAPVRPPGRAMLDEAPPTAVRSAAKHMAALPHSASVAATGSALPPVAVTPFAPAHGSFTDDQPGRVEQLPGQAGYAFSAPLGTTVTSTVTAPNLTCSAVPPADSSVETGEQITFELAGQYLMVQSFCFVGELYDRFNVLISSQAYTPYGLEAVTPGATGTLTETVYATRVVATMDIPAQRGAAAFDRTWDIPGSFTSDAGGGFIGTLDRVYTSAGGTAPFAQLAFANTDAGGEGLGAYIAAHPTSDAKEQDSVFGGTLRDQTSAIGTGSSFTITYGHIGLPNATMENFSVLQPATDTTTVDVTVSLSKTSTYPIYISYAATGLPGRFLATSGTLTFSPGETTQEIPVTILPGEGGGDVTLKMYLSNPSYATTQGSPGVVTVKAVDVTQVAPDAGVVEGGNQIVVTGDNFTGATAVVFTPLTGTPVDTTDFTVDTSNKITVTVPDLSDQLGDDRNTMSVAVQVKVGPAESPRTVSYLYTAIQPAVSSVDPNAGPLAGGTEVTIDGSGFTWTTEVVFTLADGQEYASDVVTPGEDESLVVESPAIPGSAVKSNKAIANVQVVDDDQGVVVTSAKTNANRFTYEGPVVDAVDPSTGPLAGGTEITITGDNFTDATAVVFAFANGTKITVKATTGMDGLVTVETPAASASVLSTNQAVANVEVRVTTDGSSATSPASTADQFTYKGPTVTSLSQASGPLAGGTTLTVTGTGFTGASAVLFHFSNGGVLAVPASTTSNSSITVKTPAVSASELSTDNAIADVEVQVSAGHGTTATSPATSADRFTFQGPAVSGVSPSSGPVQGGTAITVSGHGFTGATAVVFHFANGNVQSVSTSASVDTSLQVTTPEITATDLSTDNAIADVEVQVAAAGGTTATSPATTVDHFTFQGPTVKKVSPASGPVQGGTTVTITGSNLAGASEVELVAPDGTEFDAVARTVSAGSLTITTPALPATELSANQVVLEVAAEVPLADGSVAISPSSGGGKFTMKGPAVKKLSPTAGLEGTSVTVTGSNLTDANEVTFTVGGVAYSATPTKVSATSVSVVSPNIPASALTSGLAKATVQVHVPLPNSTTAISPTVKTDVFSYQAPAVTSVSPSSGPVSGGTKVTVKGKNLAKATTVTLTIGATVFSVTPTSKAAASLTFVTPGVLASLVGKSGAKAAVQVDVPAPSGVTLVSAASSKSQFTYKNPAVTKLAPTSGPSTGGTKVTVTGTELAGANEVIVKVGTTVITVTPSTVTGTSVTFSTPAIAASHLKSGTAVASVQVGVPGAGGSEAISAVVKASHFTYDSAS